MQNTASKHGSCRHILLLPLGLCFAILLSGCNHKTADNEPLPPPLPLPAKGSVRPAPANSTHYPASTTSVNPALSTPVATSEEDLEFVETHRPIYSEEGYATWYTAARGRHTANGDLFSDDAMTAAHRTLPFGSLVKVTNLKTGQSAILRITDRGPFVDGRILDLTKAAAKAIGNYREGLSHVRVEVYETPKPMEAGGKWCVQIGAFKDEDAALELKEQLMRKYPDAKVIEFPGEASYWVRIRPMDGNREQAERIAARVKPAEGTAYLTRLD